MSDSAVTVLIATRNRIDHLKLSLATVLRSARTTDVPVEVLVIDNGSTDDTLSYVRHLSEDFPFLVPAYDPIPGKSGAVNRALRLARGSVIVFTDDDVHVPITWISDMANPILGGTADAVCGRVELASHLERPWMSRLLREALAEILDVSGDLPGMVGASMAASREAALRIGFDEGLGPGARGFADDVLFNWRLKAAGYRLVGSTGPPVVHHFDPDRLGYSALRSLAERNGVCHGYLLYHWLGGDLRLVTLRRLRARLLLAAARRQGSSGRGEGISDNEYLALFKLNFYRSLLDERGQLRKGEAP